MTTNVPTDLAKAGQTEEQLETQIKEQGADKYPRVTKAQVDNRIVSHEFHVFSGRHTVCVMTLKNGFQISGESAAVSRENFRQNIGEEVAYEKARDKIWELEAYLLRERMASNSLEEIDGVSGSKVEVIAELAHNINVEYTRGMGENNAFKLMPWGALSNMAQSSMRHGVRLHLKNPDAGPQAGHEEWLRYKVEQGWVYGELKDEVAKTHPCIMPFDQLPKEQQAKDHIFRAAVLQASKLYERLLPVL